MGSKMKNTTKNKVKSNELTELIKIIIITILICTIFGYIGYKYSSSNNLDIRQGIIWGCIFPIGFLILEISNNGGLVTSIIYTILYGAAISMLPTWVGAILLILVIIFYLILFINIKIKNREKNEINSNNQKGNKEIKSEPKKIYSSEEINNRIKKILENENKEESENNADNIDKLFEDEEYECERCFKKISEEEYELNDGMCEECNMEVHTDEKGNFHDNKYFKS